MSVIEFSNAGSRRRSLVRDRIDRRRSDGANMHTFLFRSYDLIVESDEAELVRDVCRDTHKAEVKLRKVKERLQGVREQSAAQIHLLTTVETKLTTAIVAALLSQGGLSREQ